MALVLLGLSAPALSGPRTGREPGAQPGKGRPAAAVGAGPAARSRPFDPADARGRMAPLKRGNALLARGMFRLAASAFREAIAAEPDSGTAHIGLGVALARNGNCADALPEFRDWNDARKFGSRVALLAAHCADRQGDAAAAVEFSLRAWEVKRDNRTALARLALDADRLPDPVLVQVATEYLWYVNPEQDESLFVEAALALRRGDPTELDIIDTLWRREGRSDEEMNRMRARSWLDVGDPVQAYEELKQGGSKLKRGADSRVMMAEITRRLGLLADADQALHSKLMGLLTGADADAVRVRMLVDRGQLADARALLADYEQEIEEELAASRWYLARAEGDVAAMEREAAAYAVARTSPLRTLEQYIPVTAAR